MMMVMLAWKNIWRNKKRSLVILTATALGLAGGLFSVGIMTGMYDSMLDAAINRELGNIQIHTAGFKKDRLIGQYIPYADSVSSIVAAHHDVRSYAMHTVIEGMASSATTAMGVSIIGIDADRERAVTAISNSLVEGSYLDKSHSIVIGKKLAEKLKLKLHSRIVLSFSGLKGDIIYGAFKVGGIFNTDASNFDGMTVFVRREDLSALLGGRTPIHEIIIRTSSSLALDQTKKEIQDRLTNDIVVETWRDISPELKLTADSTDISNTIFLGLILFALLFGLTNTLLMSVLDRVRDFGVLLAIGMYRRRLFALIILESLFLSFTGGIIGVALGWIATQYFRSHGIDLSNFSAGLSSYGIPSLLYPLIRPALYGTLTIMMICTSVLAALYPAVKAVRLRPVEAIRTIA